MKNKKSEQLTWRIAVKLRGGVAWGLWIFMLSLLSFTGAITAVDVSSTPPATTITTTEKPKTGKYLFESVTGYGGSLMGLYGYGSPMNDTASFALRGFAHFGQSFRLGAIGTMIGRTNSPTSIREMVGGFGLFAEYLLRLDPFIVGLGVKAAGAGYSSHNPETRVRGTSYAYFNAMPFLELEFRLLEMVSLSIYGGYDYYLGNSSSPNVSQGTAGLAVTIARY